MRITIVGTGYVGLVTGACFAEMGNHVTCVDIDQEKLDKLRKGIVPIHEPGLEELITENYQAGRLDFASDVGESLNESEITFIAVGTPANGDGSADLSHVVAVARAIGQKMTRPTVIADKSTVPVGTADKVAGVIAEELGTRKLDLDFEVVSNPEFLKEGAAIEDFMYPDRVIVGCEGESSKALMRELYAPFSRHHDKLQFMAVRDAEMTKYAANAMLATRISFMNEIALMCDAYGVDVENVRKGIGSDPRIGFSFIYPGIGYGGSCFPKDVRALISMGHKVGMPTPLFEAVDSRNQAQKTVLVNRIRDVFGADLSSLTFALWGLAFKPETDDVREAPSLEIIRGIVESGGKVQAFDPEAAETAKQSLPAAWLDEGRVVIHADNPYTVIENADALVIATEWKPFRQPDFPMLAQSLKRRMIFDGRNIYDPERLASYGLTYIGIGRRSPAAESD